MRWKGRRRARTRAALPLAIAIASVGGVGPAQAQPGGSAKAEALFLEGRRAQQKGDQTTACAKFRDSLELAQVANTVFNVAQCDERDGKLVAALARWNQGMSMLKPGDPRGRVARERVAALELKVPRLTIDLASGAPPSSRVSTDGEPLEAAKLGAPLPLDPGRHSVVVEAPGRFEQRFEVDLAEGMKVSLRVAPGSVKPESEPPKGGNAGDVPPVKPPEPGSNGRRTLGFVIGGAGVLGLVAAGVTGGMLMARDGRIEEQCEDKRCTPEGRALIDGSGPLFIGNAIAWGVGVAGIGVGAYLLLSSGEDSSSDGVKAAVAPAVLPGGGGVAMVGRF